MKRTTKARHSASNAPGDGETARAGGGGTPRPICVKSFVGRAGVRGVQHASPITIHHHQALSWNLCATQSNPQTRHQYSNTLRATLSQPDISPTQHSTNKLPANQPIPTTMPAQLCTAGPSPAQPSRSQTANGKHHQSPVTITTNRIHTRPFQAEKPAKLRASQSQPARQSQSQPFPRPPANLQQAIANRSIDN